MKILSPVPIPFVFTQYYGENVDYYLKFGLARGHNGDDMIPASIPKPYRQGTPIVAPASGRLVWGESPGYGIYAYLYTDIGEFVLGHLHQTYVEQGTVQVGQVIAGMGCTGNCVPPDGVHVHFGWRPVGYYLDDGMRGYADPLSYIVSYPSSHVFVGEQ